MNRSAVAAPRCPAHPAVRMQRLPKQKIPRSTSHSESTHLQHVARHLNAILRFRCPVSGARMPVLPCD